MRLKSRCLFCFFIDVSVRNVLLGYFWLAGRNVLNSGTCNSKAGLKTNCFMYDLQAVLWSQGILNFSLNFLTFFSFQIFLLKKKYTNACFELILYFNRLVIEATNSAIYRTGDIAIDDFELTFGSDCSSVATTIPTTTTPAVVRCYQI